MVQIYLGLLQFQADVRLLKSEARHQSIRPGTHGRKDTSCSKKICDFHEHGIQLSTTISNRMSPVKIHSICGFMKKWYSNWYIRVFKVEESKWTAKINKLNRKLLSYYITSLHCTGQSSYWRKWFDWQQEKTNADLSGRGQLSLSGCYASSVGVTIAFLGPSSFTRFQGNLSKRKLWVGGFLCPQLHTKAGAMYQGMSGLAQWLDTWNVSVVQIHSQRAGGPDRSDVRTVLGIWGWSQDRLGSEVKARDRISQGLTGVRSQKPETKVKPESRGKNLS